MPRKQVICPFCFELIDMGRCHYRCDNAEGCEKEVDPVLRKHWGNEEPSGHSFIPQLTFTERLRLMLDPSQPASVACEKCGVPTKRCLCPICHQQLPFTWGREEPRIFSVIGARNSGKSTWIAVLIDQLFKEVGPANGFVMMPLSDESQRRYRTEYYNPLFRRGELLDQTQPAAARKSEPLVYSLRSGEPNSSTSERYEYRPPVTLAFFDIAGEDLNVENLISKHSRYVYRSHGSIMLIEPSAAYPEGIDDAEAIDILSRIIRLHEKGRRIHSDAPIGIPLAVCLSKFDVFRDQVQQREIWDSPDHSIGFDQDSFSRTNRFFENFLTQNGAAAFVALAKSRFSEVGFFGLSALGNEPIDGRVDRIDPVRVCDPILWLLNRSGFLPEIELQ